MAIVYSYPTAVPESQDLLMGVEMAVQGGEGTPRTKTFTIGSVTQLAVTEAADSAAELYATITSVDLKADLTGATFTGDIIAPAFIKEDGLSTEYLMADGSTFTGGGEYAFPTLQQVTTTGPTTTTDITANSFIKQGGTGENILLDDGDTVALSSIVGNTNLTTTQTASNFTINSDTGDDAMVPLGNGTLAGATLNNYTTDEQTKLAGIQAGAEVNVNADWNAVSGDAQILNKPTISGTNTGDQDLQQVTTKGASTTTAITVTVLDDDAITGNSSSGSGVSGIATADDGTGVFGTAVDGIGVYAETTNEGGALFVDGGSLGVGAVVLNGGLNITGLVNPVTGFQLKLSSDSAQKPNGGMWTGTSDLRVKQNISPYAKGLAEILLVDTVNFEYNGLANTETGIEYVGIIAQDIKDIFPETISTYETKLNQEDEEKTELYSFDASPLTFALINAVKQLSAEIELLKSK